MKRLVLPFLLTSVAASGATLTWDGSSSGSWATGANWNTGTAPTGASGSPDVLIFPSGGANKTMSNNLAAGLNFNRLSLADGYTLSGNGVTMRILSGTLPTISYTGVAGGQATVNVPVTLASHTSFSTNTDGRLNLGALSDPVLGANTLTLTAGTNGRIEMDGTTSGTGGVTMDGSGHVVLDASQNATGTYSLTGGRCTLLISTITGPITTAGGTVLSAINANGSSSVTLAGDLEVTLSFDVAGNLAFTGTGSNDNLTLGIGGTLPGSSYDQIRVEGNVTTGAHRLQLDTSGGYPLGTEFKLIANSSPFAINSTTKFLTPAGVTLAEGGFLNAGALRLQFSYAGGDGNDFTATVVPAISSGTATWDGGTDAANELRTANNWSGDVIPTAGQVLIFGDGTAEKSLLNNGGGNYGGLQFTGTGGYLIQDDAPTNVGKLLMLSSGGIAASHTPIVCTLATPLSVVANQNWSVSSSGSLSIDAAGSVLLEGFNLTLNPSSTGVLNLNAPVSGTGNLNKDGSGLAVIGGTAANTYTGTTAVTRGELRLSKSGSATALTGSITLGGGANPATLSTTAAENIADTAVLTMQANGTLQLGGTETLAGLVYNGGSFNNGANLLALAGNFTANESVTLASPLQFNGANRDITVASGKTLTLSGALGISPGGLGVTHFKKGPGTLIFSGTAPAVTLQADAGVLQIDTTDAANRPLVALNGGTVQGNGRSREVTSMAGGGTFTPGLGTGSSIWQNRGLSFNSATTLVLDLNGTTAGTGFDQLAVLEGGPVSLGNAVLQIRDNQLYPVGTVFRIIDKDGTAAISGTFAGLPAGASIAGAFNRYTISYTGGTGNDVVLTVAAVDSGITRTWDAGGGANRNWSTAANWSGDVVPGPGDTLEFPLTALTAGSGPVNDLPAGIIFHRIRFTGAVSNTGIFAISGNAIGLSGGVENLAQETTTSFGRVIAVQLPITTQPGAIISNLSPANPRTLRFTQPLTTTTGSLRFTGRGGASPQESISFSGSAATISGAARIFVESNASVTLNGFSTSAWSGGTEVIHGSITGIPHARLAEGFVLTAGTDPVLAGVLGGTASTGTAISVPSNATLIGGPLLCASLSVAGEASLSGLTATGTVDVTGTLDTGSGTLQAATLNLLAGSSTSGRDLSATTITNTGGTVSFTGTATLGNALTVDGTDSFSCGTLSAPGFTRNGGTFSASDMTLAGDFQLQNGSFSIPGRLTFQPGATRLLNIANNRSFGMAGLGGTAGNPVTINKTGSGGAVVSTSLTFINSLTISGGALTSDAADGGSVPVTVAGGTLGGSGFFGPVSLNAAASGSTISPGSSPGQMDVASLVASGSGNIPSILMEISGPAIPGTFHDQITAHGDVSFPPGALTQLNLFLSIVYVPLTGTTYTLIDKTAAGAISGQLFDGLTPITENSEKTISGVTFRFSYQGGDGNDFTATVTNSPAGAYRVWDGGGADANWTTGENWSDDSAPLPTESLRFPAGAARLTNNNNYDPGTRFGEIKVEAAYTFYGNAVNPARGFIADLAGGAVTAGMPVNFQTGDTALISLAGGGSLNVTGQINLADLLTLTLRRTDPSFVFGGQPLDVAAIRRSGGATVNDVLIEGGGRVRFRNGTRDYTGTTFVRHGRLQLDGATAAIPGNLTIGGGAGEAKFENPGSGAAGIPNTATLRLEAGGEHIFVGGGTLSDIIGTLDFAGGATSGGSLPVRNRWITRAPFNYSTTGARTFDTEVAPNTKTIEIETGARHTIPAGSSISGGFTTFTLRKEGGGELRMGGTLTATTVAVAAGTLTADTGGAINATTVTAAGGIIAGAGTFNADITGNASGGSIAPGIPGAATPFGILTISEKDYLPAPQTTLSIQIGGTTPGTAHDQLRQINNFNNPVIDLNESLLAISLVNGFQPTPGQTFTIIDKATPGAVVRNFAGTPEGHTFVAAGREWTITYQGGTGNDVVLTAGNAVLTPLQQWRQTHFGTTENTGNAANDFDFDNDGLTNLVEFAFGLIPTSSASATLPQAVQQGSDLVLSFTPPPGVSGITYHGETSTTLAAPSWNPVTNTGTAPVKEFRIPMTGLRAFLRIRISEP